MSTRTQASLLDDETKKAQGSHKPGDGTTPPIANGAFVQFGSTRGRVDLVVTNGKVPGVEEDVEGSKNSPAVRVAIWDKDGDGYKPSRRKVGKMMHTVKKIPPLTRSGKAAPGADLVALLADHEARGLDESSRVTGTAVKTVYDRGCNSWPGFEATSLTRQQWATGRVKAFLSVAAGDDPGAYSRDLGLLSKAHPRHPEHQPVETKDDHADHADEGAEGAEGDTVIVDGEQLTKHLSMFAEFDDQQDD